MIGKERTEEQEKEEEERLRKRVRRGGYGLRKIRKGKGGEVTRRMRGRGIRKNKRSESVD